MWVGDTTDVLAADKEDKGQRGEGFWIKIDLKVLDSAIFKVHISKHVLPGKEPADTPPTTCRPAAFGHK